jgi:hypothetical protein
VSIATGGAGIQLRNMTGTFTNVTSAPADGHPPFVVRENVAVATAGSMTAIKNTPPLGPRMTPPGPPCGRNPEN